MPTADYHARRAAQEEALAEKASNDIARNIHLQLADQHAQRVKSDPPATLHLVHDDQPLA